MPGTDDDRADVRPAPALTRRVQGRLARVAATVTPLRSRRVREHLQRSARARDRRRREGLEAKGDWSLSRPALHGLDDVLERHLDVEHGTFVEAGANDGYAQSNTYFLERARGWTGVLIEAIPALAQEAEATRPGSRVYACALVPPELEGSTVTLRYGGLMSLVRGAQGSEADEDRHLDDAFLLGSSASYDVEAPGRTLSSVLDEAGIGAPDLLSLDLEGYEPQALRGLDLGRHAPRWILVEALDPDAGRGPLEEILGDRYDLVGAVSPQDLLYRRRDDAQRSP